MKTRELGGKVVVSWDRYLSINWRKLSGDLNFVYLKAKENSFDTQTDHLKFWHEYFKL